MRESIGPWLLVAGALLAQRLAVAQDVAVHGLLNGKVTVAVPGLVRAAVRGVAASEVPVGEPPGARVQPRRR